MLAPGSLLTFIGLCIAAFAFLASYLRFAKNFLEKLYNLDNKGIKKESGTIVKFFFALDLIVAWILVFLIFSMFLSIGFLVVKLQLAWCEYPYTGLRWSLFILIILYMITMCLIFIKAARLRKDHWEPKSRRLWLGFCWVLMITHGLFSLCFVHPFRKFPFWSGLSELGWFFISILFMIVLLFVLFIFVLNYDPLTELARYWEILEDNK